MGVCECHILICDKYEVGSASLEYAREAAFTRPAKQAGGLTRRSLLQKYYDKFIRHRREPEARSGSSMSSLSGGDGKAVKHGRGWPKGAPKAKNFT